MKLFNKPSLLYDFRWFLLILFISAALMAWYDLTGDRILESSVQQTWTSSGPGYHK